ncbi:MAG: hypothetical protein ABIJ56_05695 [Pseudomonadota bacterium]
MEKSLFCVIFLLLSSGNCPAGEDGKKGQGAVTLEKEEFKIRVDAPSEVKAGTEARLKVTILPVSPYKINDVTKEGKKFPFKVSLTADEGLSLDKTTFKRDDASELSKQKVVFNIPFTAQSAGEFNVKLKVNLSVCKEGKCVFKMGVEVSSKITSQ